MASSPIPPTTKPLELGKIAEGEVAEGEYTFFYIEVTKKAEIQVELICESGDPDLFVSVNNREPTQDDYTWRSGNIGNDIITITPYDPHFVIGNYYIGIFADTTSKYKLLATTQEPCKPLAPGEPFLDSLEKGTYHYYSIDVNRLCNINVTINPHFGDPDLFVCNTNERPKNRESTWESGAEGGDTVTIRHDDENFTLGTYYISVYGDSECSYILLVSFSEPESQYGIPPLFQLCSSAVEKMVSKKVNPGSDTPAPPNIDLATLDGAVATKVLAHFGEFHRLSKSLLEAFQACKVTSITFSRSLIALDDMLAILAKYPVLESLDLSHTHIKDATVHALEDFAALKSLNLMGCDNITDAALTKVNKQLETLNLAECPITDEGLKALQQRGADLRNLDLSSTKVTGQGLIHLLGLEKLESLNLSNLDDDQLHEGLIHLVSKAKLTSLSISNTASSGHTFRAVSQIKGLLHLDLAHCQIRDDDIAHMKELPSLTHLNLSDTAITDSGLGSISHLTSLVHLDLDNCAIHSIECLKALSKLEFLCLAHTKLMDSDAPVLSSFENLKHLDISSTDVSDTGFEHLGKLVNLEVLHMQRIPVTEAGIEKVFPLLTKLSTVSLSHVQNVHPRTPDNSIKAMATSNSKLRHLELYDDRVTDLGVSELKPMVTLQTIKLWKTKVTKSGINELRESLPGTKFFLTSAAGRRPTLTDNDAKHKAVSKLRIPTGIQAARLDSPNPRHFSKSIMKKMMHTQSREAIKTGTPSGAMASPDNPSRLSTTRTVPESEVNDEDEDEGDANDDNATGGEGDTENNKDGSFAKSKGGNSSRSNSAVVKELEAIKAAAAAKEAEIEKLRKENEQLEQRAKSLESEKKTLDAKLKKTEDEARAAQQAKEKLETQNQKSGTCLIL